MYVLESAHVYYLSTRTHTHTHTHVYTYVYTCSQHRVQMVCTTIHKSTMLLTSVEGLQNTFDQ